MAEKVSVPSYKLAGSLVHLKKKGPKSFKEMRRIVRQKVAAKTLTA